MAIQNPMYNSLIQGIGRPQPQFKSKNFAGALTQGISDWGKALMARNIYDTEKTKEREAEEAVAGIQEQLNALDPNSMEYVNTLRANINNPNVDPETRKYWQSMLEGSLNRQHQMDLQNLKLNTASRSSVLGGKEAHREAIKRGSALPESAFYNEDGTERYYRFTREGFDRWYPEGKPQGAGKGDQKGYQDAVSKSVYGANMAAGVLQKAERLEKLWEAANNQGITGAESFLGRITGLWELNPATKDYLEASAEIGKNLALEYQQAAKALGLQEVGTSTEGDADRWASNIASLNPFKEDGTRKPSHTMEEAWAKIERVQNNFRNKVANKLLRWRTETGENEKGDATKTRKLYLYGIQKPEFDVTYDSPRDIFIKLNEAAADAEIGLEFDPNVESLVADAIHYSLSKAGKDPGARFDTLTSGQEEDTEEPEGTENADGSFTSPTGVRYTREKVN